MATIKYLPPAKADLSGVQWLTAGKTEPADFNLLCFFEMNEPVCFKNSLPAVFKLHERWGVGTGKEADKLRKTFRAYAVSCGLADWQVNNMRRTKEWIATGQTQGKVAGEYGSLIQNVPHPKDMAIGMDTIQRRTRNRAKLTKMAEKLLEEQPWQHDPHVLPEHTIKNLTNYLSGTPFHGKCTDANDMTQSTPAFIIFDKEYNVIWRHVGNVTDVHLRDILLPYLMNAKKPKPLCPEEWRQASLKEYREAKKYTPGAHTGQVIKHHDGKESDLDGPAPPKEVEKDKAAEAEREQKKKEEEAKKAAAEEAGAEEKK